MGKLEEYFKVGLDVTYPRVQDFEANKKAFINLLSEYNIEANENDLFTFFCSLSNEWCFVEYKLELPKSDDNFTKDCKTLLQGLDTKKGHKISRIEFGLQAGQGFVSNNTAIGLIFQYLDAESLKEELKSYSENNKLTESSKINKIKQNFLDTLIVPFIGYLKNETNLKTESDNDIYRFVKKFCLLAGVNWNTFSDQPDPASYLKKIVHNHKKKIHH